MIGRLPIIWPRQAFSKRDSALKGVSQAQSSRGGRKGCPPLGPCMPADSATAHLWNGIASEAHARMARAKSREATLRREVHAAQAALEARAGAVEPSALGECGPLCPRWANETSRQRDAVQVAVDGVASENVDRRGGPRRDHLINDLHAGQAFSILWRVDAGKRDFREVPAVRCGQD